MYYLADGNIKIRDMVKEDTYIIYNTYLSYNWHPVLNTYLGAWLHSGYGAAQRIYIKRGYIPDGSRVWWNGKNLEQYAKCINNDEVILYLLKEL